MLLHTCKFAYFTLLSKVMYLRMAVWTKGGGFGRLVVTCNLITTYQFQDQTVLCCLLFMLPNCISGRTSAYEAIHAAIWYFNTNYKLVVLRWSLCVTTLCNLKCKCRVSCVCDNIVVVFAPASLSTNLSLYSLVHNPGATKMFFPELRWIFYLHFMYHCPLSGTVFKLTAFGRFVYHEDTLA